jgi:hypothetical protein
MLTARIYLNSWDFVSEHQSLSPSYHVWLFRHTVSAATNLAVTKHAIFS